MTKKQTTPVDDVKPTADNAEETPSDPKETPPADPDPKTLARQRSKDDLARKRQNMRQNKGKR